MRILMSVLLTLGCVLAGYAFYKMNPDDWINSIAFGFGLLGIMFSFLRTTKSPDDGC